MKMDRSSAGPTFQSFLKNYHERRAVINRDRILKKLTEVNQNSGMRIEDNYDVDFD
jgi:hypothetical protein